jgi:hypothetical protein
MDIMGGDGDDGSVVKVVKVVVKMEGKEKFKAERGVDMY